jgi:hypothetical protein
MYEKRDYDGKITENTYKSEDGGEWVKVDDYDVEVKSLMDASGMKDTDNE